MKPTEDCNVATYNIEEFDFEISPVELVQDIGVLIIEGRLPDFSQNGRREGSHCWPVFPNSKKECCDQDITDKSTMCYFVKSARREIKQKWNALSPLFVEVLVCLDAILPNNETDRSPCEIYLQPENTLQHALLLERWKLEICKKSTTVTSSVPSSSSFVSINLLLQAMRSFLHFSQLSAWLMRTGGRVPKQIMYRIVCGEFGSHLDFKSIPEIHEFPQALTSKTQHIRTTVFTLPRFDLETLISMSPYRNYNLAIERQILKSSYDRSHSSFEDNTPVTSEKKLRSFYKSEMFENEKEKTPIRTSDDLKNAAKDGHCVVFVADPAMHFRGKVNGNDVMKVSKQLRKKLSFESACTKTEATMSFKVQDLVGECGGASVNKFRGFSHCEEKETKNQSKYGNMKRKTEQFVKRGKSQECLEEDERRMNLKECSLEEAIKLEGGNQVNSCESSGKNGTSCDLGCDGKSDTSFRRSDCLKCNFQIGDDFTKKDSSQESSYCSILNVTIDNQRHEQSRVLDSDAKENVDVILDSNGKKNSLNVCNISQNGQIKELDFVCERKVSLLEKRCEKAAENFDRKEDNEMMQTRSIPSSNSHCVSLTSQSRRTDSLKDSKPNSDRCQSVASLSSLDCKGANLDRLRRCESYSGARPKQMTSSYAGCSVAVFNSSTGLPITSSPAPLRRPEGNAHFGAVRNGECSSPSVAIRKTRKSSYDTQYQSQTKLLLSRSAPASTRLLGNFEESVLKGRLPVFGTVEGFTAELGASGSFCPQHITLPIKCQFFRTSDDNAPSPYMGHITFRKSKGKRGYHVPRKGTIQLTLFNPNKTVVKVFVVIYDFEDMPSNSHTFLRQKIVSVKKGSNSLCDEESQSLHYLVHLRFASTRHDHVYLHTDIRLIFPQQNPEVSSSKLKVLTYGPVEPKYTLRNR